MFSNCWSYPDLYVEVSNSCVYLCTNSNVIINIFVTNVFSVILSIKNNM